MDQQKVFIDLDRAHRLIGKVKLRLAISNLLPPKCLSEEFLNHMNHL